MYGVAHTIREAGDMGGFRLRRDQEDAHNSQHLNSTRLNLVRRNAFERFLASAAVVAFMAGAPMGAMKQASAQTQTDVQGVRVKLVDDFSAAKKILDSMPGAGMISHIHLPVQTILADLVTLNERLKPSNGGMDVIPISGATPKERFNSVNRWLGQDPGASWTSDIVKQLQTKVEAALASPYADAGTPGLLAKVNAGEGVAPPSTVAGTTEEVRPPVAEIKPSKPTSESLRAENAQLLSDLNYISENGDKAAKKKAKKQLTALENQLDARRINLKNVDKQVKVAQAFVDKEFKSAMSAASEKGRKLTAPGPHPFDKEMEDLKAELLAKSTTQAGKDAAKLLPDLWLLGYLSMDETISLLNKAASASDADAQKYVKRAQGVYEDQQKRYRRVLEDVIIPVAKEIASLDPASLPKEYSAKIKKLWQDRLAEAEKLKTADRIPFNAVYNLYVAVAEESVALQNIVSTAGYAKAKSLPGADQLAKEYSGAIRTSFIEDLEAGSQDPFREDSPKQRETNVRLFLGLGPNEPLDKTTRENAEKKMRALYRSSKQYRYDDSAVNVYDTIIREGQVPVPSDPVITALAEVRSLRAVYAFNLYLRYRDNEARINEADKFKADSVSPKRFELAKEFLTKEITAAEKLMAALQKESKSQTMEAAKAIETAKALLASATKAPSAENIPAASDNLYYAALCLASLAENYGWANKSELQRDLGDKKDNVISWVKANLKTAEEEYVRAFSKVKLDSPYHAAVSHQLADNGSALSVATNAFAVTEMPAMYTATQAYVYPPGYNTDLSDDFTPEQALETAALVEAKHLSILVASKDDKTLFPQSATAASIARAKLRGQFNALNWAEGEAQLTTDDAEAKTKTLRNITVDDPLFADFRFPDLEKRVITKGKPMSTEVDRHFVPDANTAIAFASAPHEWIEHSNWGATYNEVRSQLTAAFNDSTPAFLQNFKTPPAQLPVRKDFEAQDKELRSKTEAAMKTLIQNLGGAESLGITGKVDEYVSNTPPLVVLNNAMRKAQLYAGADESRLARLNSINVAVLDLRIAELETRLNGKVKLNNGSIVSVRSLETSKNEGSYYVTRAKEWLAEAQKYRGKVSLGTNLYVGINPKLATAIAENGIEALRDEHLQGLTPGVTVTFTPTVKPGKVLETGGNLFQTWDATVNVSGVDLPKNGQLLPEYEKKNGVQNLGYNWVFYAQYGGNWMVINPELSKDPNYVRKGGAAFIGMAVKLPSGEYAVVRVQKPGEKTGFDQSKSLEYAAYLDASGNYDVLYKLEKAKDGSMTLNPQYVDSRAAAMVYGPDHGSRAGTFTQATTLDAAVKIYKK